MQHKITLTSPLFTDWTEQYVRLQAPAVAPLALTINGAPTPFQFTGNGTEILVRLGFARGETKELVFTPATANATQLEPVSLPLGQPIGAPGRELLVTTESPFAGFAGFPFTSRMYCEQPFERATLARTNDGPLFTDYRLRYEFAEQRHYTLRFRCYKLDPYVEVSEHFALRMNAELVWTLNPQKMFTHIISRDSFEGENQPTVEPLGESHPRDVLCRLQMPVISEYFIPNNRGWFAFCDERNPARAMLGILGLYGARWEEPVANMPEIFDRGGTVEWHASLASGKRYWLLYTGPVEKTYTPERRFVFHRLHAEFNACRLDEHLDLTGEGAFDASCATEPGMFVGEDYRARARQRLAAFPCLQAILRDSDQGVNHQGNGVGMHHLTFGTLLEPTDAKRQALYESLIARFEKWVRQFQGYRTGEHDYMKNVIGFSRWLRGMLIAHELLRKDGALSEEQARKLNAYFAFAARRILDEGRWPHSRTWKHPDHPESSRDFYTYGGEHKPDRLVWTNSLPNFQSDPMCALAHLSAMFKDHPDAAHWRRFALDDIDRQLDAYCGKSGAWEESINYALYTFSYFVITFKAVKERWGIDYFHDERVRRFAGWLCRFFGPRDKRFDAYTWPGIGNAVVPQNQAEYLLCYASELAADDPLRADCLAVWQRCAEHCRPWEHYPVVMAAMADAEISNLQFQISPLSSEVMDEVGVALRDRHTQPDESYLFQKIGFAKDHYEADETAFNWYAKGTPFCMDYGTYTGDIAVAGAHNVVEVPDEDNLRRGYLAHHLFSPIVDYTHCEVPVTLKLLWGKVRSFAEVENKDGKIHRDQTPYYYIGDKNPVGPKCWKVRLLLFVKPDYVVLFDRVYGEVPHRYNLHFTGDSLQRTGNLITARGRFDLDLLLYVQSPAEFAIETGELVPNYHPAGKPDESRKHAQHYVRLYNHQDGIYRTVIFAQERGRAVQIQSLGRTGLQITTPEYTDHVFLHNDVVREPGFVGRAGWLRRRADGTVQVCVPDGEWIAGFGREFTGRGPWTYNLDQPNAVTLRGGPPRTVRVR